MVSFCNKKEAYLHVPARKGGIYLQKSMRLRAGYVMSSVYFQKMQLIKYNKIQIIYLIFKCNRSSVYWI
jgi:hypothetical protein